MKHLFLLSILLFTTIAPAQDKHFARHFDQIVILSEEEGERRLDSPTRVDFNVSSTNDIIVTIDDLEPLRYTPVSDIMEEVIGGLSAQIIKVRLVDRELYYHFALYRDGDFVIYNIDTGYKMMLRSKNGGNDNIVETYNRTY